MLEREFPADLREFTRKACEQAIEDCRNKPAQAHYIPDLLRELAASYEIEADLTEEKNLSEAQRQRLFEWHMRGAKRHEVMQ